MLYAGDPRTLVTCLFFRLFIEATRQQHAAVSGAALLSLSLLGCSMGASAGTGTCRLQYLHTNRKHHLPDIAG